jgi:hypothetical protein
MELLTVTRFVVLTFASFGTFSWIHELAKAELARLDNRHFSRCTTYQWNRYAGNVVSLLHAVLCTIVVASSIIVNNNPINRNPWTLQTFLPLSTGYFLVDMKHMSVKFNPMAIHHMSAVILEGLAYMLPETSPSLWLVPFMIAFEISSVPLSIAKLIRGCPEMPKDLPSKEDVETVFEIMQVFVVTFIVTRIFFFNLYALPKFHMDYPNELDGQRLLTFVLYTISALQWYWMVRIMKMLKKLADN